MNERSNWRPTNPSIALVVLVSLLTATVLVRAIGVSLPATLGGLGAVTLAVATWTAGWNRYRAVGTLLTSLLALPVGIGLVAATIGTVLVLAGVLFPVPSIAELPAAVVDLSARALVVVGAVGTVFGAAAATGGVLDRETVQRAAGASVKTVLLPFVVGVLLVVGEVLSFLESNADVPGVGAVVGDVLRRITTVFFQPPATRPHLTTFLLLVAVAVWVTRETLQALPVSELTTSPSIARTVAGVRRVLFWLAALLGLGIVVGIAIDYLLPASLLRALVTPVGFEFVTAVTTTPLLRSLAWTVILVGLGAIAAVGLLRHLVQTSADRIGTAVAPFVAGTIVVVWTVVLADPALSFGIDWVAGTLPGEFGPHFRAMAEEVVDFYGALAIVMVAVSGVLLVAAAAVVGIWLVLLTKYLDDRTAGIAIASGALFQTAAFAGVVGVSSTVLFGSLVAAVFVWDTGEFGTTLGQEVGRRANTRQTELVHASGTLAVGSVGAVVAFAVTELGVGAISVADGTVVLALLAVLSGLLLLLVALR